MRSIAPDCRVVTYGLAAATALLIEHVALWHPVLRLRQEEGYALGTATLGLAFTAWGIRHGHTQAVAAWWLIAGMGGGAVLSAYWMRRYLDAADQAAFEAGQLHRETQRYAPDAEVRRGRHR